MKSINAFRFTVLVLTSLFISSLKAQVEPLSVDYFEGDTLTSINTGTSAGTVSTFTLDEDCETLRVSINDPANAPLGGFSAYAYRVRDIAGNQVTDLTDNLNVTMRVRSAVTMTISVLFRSGGGTSDERSELKSFEVPGGDSMWTEVTIAYENGDLGGLNPADIRDLWFYLDRGTDNFAGNELYIDHIAVGGAPDSDRNSGCSLDGGGITDDPFFADYFEGDSLISINTESSAGVSTTFTIDTTCETLILTVTDPAENPLGEYFPYAVRVNDAQGNQVTDLTDRMTVSMRVRSAGTVTVGLLFRSGGGSADERTALKEIVVPGNLAEWSEFEVNFTAEDLEGLNPADIRDFWFYLERGVPNFPGNFIEFDHIAIGGAVDPARNSPCTTSEEPSTFVEQWQTDNASLFTGTEAARLSLTVNEDCEELMVSVTDPENSPLQAFRPLVINPVSEQGVDIKELEGEVNVYVRARSAADMPLSVVLRSGDGSPSFRTNVMTQTIHGTLDAWTTLVYTFSETDLAGFDQSDLLDAWIYLDQNNDNFPGNDLYFDYIAIGAAPDTLQNSPCGLPDVISGNDEPLWNRNLRYYPNPVNDQLTVQYPGGDSNLKVVLIDALGRTLSEFSLTMAAEELRVNTGDLASGVYYLHFYQKGSGHIVRKLIKR
ncbi:T9SS type A sorting domain-containing protein [Neolewinella aurantiaca]|uniref:T9SS type A sorting domain-containing protein n=1 Tax=Neolewinella aurantiaca TaxID=2602767 RepID=A0A5C7G0L7_9BACT|nr:T9SS type A sorting domain-containing protein [Neolewinella aurantiaca]TXF91773.1 T9SS type A sorting domain-containing protein [Neolewinella aurantiaca]